MTRRDVNFSTNPNRCCHTGRQSVNKLFDTPGFPCVATEWNYRKTGSGASRTTWATTTGILTSKATCVLNLNCVLKYDNSPAGKLVLKGCPQSTPRLIAPSFVRMSHFQSFALSRTTTRTTQGQRTQTTRRQKREHTTMHWRGNGGTTSRTALQICGKPCPPCRARRRVEPRSWRRLPSTYPRCDARVLFKQMILRTSRNRTRTLRIRVSLTYLGKGILALNYCALYLSFLPCSSTTGAGTGQLQWKRRRTRCLRRRKSPGWRGEFRGRQG